ncbi:MAG: SUMF1/EgtB/PvdO family nonheme iron enzyme [Polyangiaceae bacterium]
MRRAARFAVFIPAILCSGWIATIALADDAGAPPQSVAQVSNALSAIAPAFDPKKRKIAVGASGSIEEAIGAHVPTKFHAVTEGALALVVPNAKCPAEMALSGGGRFCIDRWEDAVIEKLPGETEKPHAIYEPLSSTHVYVAKSAAGVTPQAYVSGAEALAACHNAGKRLCEPVEWRAACGGSNGYAFPYGPTRIAKKCKDYGAAPMVVYHASSLARGFDNVELNDPRNIQLAGTVAKSGAAADCVTDEGVFDMVGNLDEWTADPNGTFQGGYWLDTSQHGDGCAYRTIGHDFGYHDYSLGFRCCADPVGDSVP